MTGCKSSNGGRKPLDGGSEEDGGDASDDDGGTQAGSFKLSKMAGLRTDEGGATDSFTIALSSKPSANVTLRVSSSDESEGKVNPATLVFTPEDWSAPKTITVTGQQDDEEDGEQEYRVVFAPAESTDSNYAGKKPGDVTAVNVDDDTAGVSLLGAANLVTSEPNVSTSYRIKLNTKPTANVSIALTSSDTGEVTAAPSTLTFTADNWNAEQTVTLTGVDDNEADGDITVKITGVLTSSDARYMGIQVPEVTVVNRDNESAGFFVVPTSGLRVFEDNRRGDSFTVALNTQPTANVTIPVSSSKVMEAVASPATLTFTRDNWNAPQRVNVTGVDDMVVDGDQEFTIVLGAATSPDVRYMGKDPADVTGINVDDESAGFSVANQDLVAREGGKQASFTLELNGKPTAPVTVAVTSLTTSQATVSPATLTFTATNYKSPQKITVTAVDDTVADGAQQVTIDLAAAVSADARYSGKKPDNVVVTVEDNDSAGLDVVPVDLITDELGGTGRITVALAKKPTATVTVPVSSSDEGEITVSPKTLTFTVDNWRSAQAVTLTGVSDDLIDGNQNATITVGPSASTDAAYVGKSQTLVATNVDKDTAAAIVEPEGIVYTDESGKTVDVSVRLTKAPTAPVKVKVSVSNPAEASISTSELTFTPDDFATRHVVTLTGLPDMGVADGNQPYLLSFESAESTDTNYNGLVIPAVLAYNNDLDSPGILTSFDVPPGPNPDEGGGTQTFYVRLKSRPTAPVTLQFASTRQDEGLVTPTQITVQPDAWQGTTAITVTGQNDLFDDGDQPFQITIVSASTDANYAGQQAEVDFLNEDDDQAGFDVTYQAPLTPPLTTREDGRVTKFYVALRARPMSDVVIPLSSSRPTEGTVLPAALTFTRDDWRSPHEVVVTGVGDLKADGDATYFINFGQATGDAVYAALAPLTPMEITNIDTDSAGIYVERSGTTTTEDGAQIPATTIRVSLRNKPAPGQTVRIPMAVSDLTEASLNVSDVTFTDANFDSPQEVTVTGEDDAIADGNIAYQVVFAPAISNDPAYAGRVAAALSYTNLDNDTAGIAVVLPDPLNPIMVTKEGDPSTASFGVRLQSQPVGTVTMTVTASATATGEVTFGPSTLTFTASNYNNPGAHQVTISSVDDLVADGPQTYTLQLAVTSAPDDENYRNLPPPAAINGRNDDDDSVGIVVFNSPVTLNTSESLTTATFQVRLNSRPTAPVTLTVTSSNTDEAVVVAPATVSFNADAAGAGSFGVYQTVTLQGVNDDLADGAKNFTVTVAVDAATADAKYAALAPVSIAGVNADNDSPGIRIFDADRNELFAPYALPNVAEDGSNPFTFYVSLNSQPFNPVSIPIASNDLSEVAIDTAELRFDGNNWATLQPVNVVGVNDAIDDGDAISAIVLATPVSDDAGYANALLGKSLPVRTIDDDSAGIIVNATAPLVTYEEATTATFTVRLNSEPTEPVIIDVASSHLNEATVSPAVLTFDASNWSTVQTVTVTSVNDHISDGTVDYNITLVTRPSTELRYNARGVPDSPLQFKSREVSTSCATLQATVRTPTAPQLPSGTYRLDPDSLAGPVPAFNAYCDMTTVSDGITGGWTLLSWTEDSESLGGVPYPGVNYIDPSAVDPSDIRGSAVPASAVDALFDLSSELAQAQAITMSGLGAISQFDDLGVYEYVGSFKYGSLANLSITASPGCAGLTTGTYTTIKDPDDAMLNNGATVYLNQGLHYADDAALSNFSAGQPYVWSVGNRTAYCALNGTPPASFIGTWQDAQYGPRYQNTAGAYSVWVR